VCNRRFESRGAFEGRVCGVLQCDMAQMFRDTDVVWVGNPEGRGRLRRQMRRRKGYININLNVVE